MGTNPNTTDHNQPLPHSTQVLCSMEEDSQNWPLAEYQFGQTGKQNLVDPYNYRYRRHSTGPVTTKWRCTKTRDPVKRCPATATTTKVGDKDYISKLEVE